MTGARRVMRGWQTGAAQEQQTEQEAEEGAEAGGLEGHKERSHRVVLRLCVSMTGGGVWQDHSSGGGQNIRVRMWPRGNGVGRRRRVG